MFQNTLEIEIEDKKELYAYQKGDIDSRAAALILQDFIEENYA